MLVGTEMNEGILYICDMLEISGSSFPRQHVTKINERYSLLIKETENT